MTLYRTLATTIVLVLLVYELLVLAILALFPYLPDPGLATLNAGIYSFLEPASTVFLLGLLYAWLVRLGTTETRRRSSRFDHFIRFLAEPIQKIVSTIKTMSLSDAANSLRILSRPRLLLAVSIIISILLVFIPYRPDLNPTGNLVGVDSSAYVGWIGQMLTRPLPQALQYSFVEGLDGSRPLLLVLLYLVTLAGPSPPQIIEYLPMILAPLLSLSTYVFVRYGQGTASLAGLTAVFTSISSYTTVGLWGGYYANWLALSLAYLFMTSLLVFSKKSSSRNYAILYSLSIALFMTHPWTWVLIITVGLAFAISLYRETRNIIHLKSTFGVIITGIILDIVKSSIFATRTVAADIATKTPGGVGSLFGFWNNLVQALLYTHAGLMADWLILLLGLLAAFVLRFKDPFERLLLLWVAMPSIPFLVLDSYSQARILYDLPIPVLTSVAVIFFLPRIGPKSLRSPGLVVALLLVTIANYALQGILLI